MTRKEEAIDELARLFAEWLRESSEVSTSEAA